MAKKATKTIAIDSVSDLFNFLFEACNILRGPVSQDNFKDYITPILYYKRISDVYDEETEAALEESGGDKEYASLPEQHRFVIPEGCSWNDIRERSENLGAAIVGAMRKIELANPDTLYGVLSTFSAQKWTDKKNLSDGKIRDLIEHLSTRRLGDKDYPADLMGDAYEILLKRFADDSKAKAGEFYTPRPVVSLLVRILDPQPGETVYDPACGSGSLLLKAEKVLGRDAVRNGFFGQEINITTYNLCRINMFLHDIEFDKFDIACEDTLISPQHWDDEPFELIVSNPPYSIKWAGDENPLLINDPRFAPAGVLAPKSKADLAFIMHSLSWLAPNGTAAIVCFPGIMYRGGAEQKIRKYLIDHNFVDCVIQLPSNLFFGTSIATCIMVLKKGKPDSKVLFIDATNECIKVTNNNKLTQANMDRIVDTFAGREEVQHFSHLASYDEIAENDYNLSVSSYVEAEDTREKVDIVKLNAEIREIVAREQTLRDEIDKIIAEIEG